MNPIVLKIKRGDLIEALNTEVDLYGGGWFLDTETGDILLKSDGVDDLPEDLEDNPRFYSIEPISSRESFHIMEAFVENLGSSQIAERLEAVLKRPKPFRCFKDTLYDYPNLPEAWFAFEQKKLERLAEQWCEQNGIDVEWI